MNDENYVFRRFYQKKRVEEIDKKIKLLGSHCNLKTYAFLNLQYVGTVIVFILGLFVRPFG